MRIRSAAALRPLLAIAVCALMVPAATAHGAPEPREIDDRLLTDMAEGNAYGGPGGLLGEGAFDLQALDIREGTLPGTTTPALIFRVTAQLAEEGTHRIEITGEAGGEAFTLDFQTDDLEKYRSDAFDVVDAPLAAGDEHVAAMEGYIRHQALGIQPGDELSDIRVMSHKDGEPGDIMPGTWYLQGEEVPAVPDEEPEDPATFTTRGPTPLFEARADTDLLELGHDGVDVKINLTSLLGEMDQTIDVNVTTPDGIEAIVGGSVPLDADGSGRLSLRFEGAGTGDVRVFLQSDLGYAVQVTLPVQGDGTAGTGSNVDSGDLAEGESFQYRFTAPGTFEYHCHPHPWMLGTISIVEGNQSVKTHVVRIIEPSQGDSQEWGFDPAELTIQVGDTVVWVNDGQAIHTVMGSTGLGGHDHHDHDHDHGHQNDDADKDTPAPFILLALIGALFVARRRA